ncbi:hypothetical protein AC578_9028 [Pseudocercospora eumusae]|uniref:Autophagy-related protein n=1 Tax=Pseudocercospora eumusae TaxID=321146 RepID=A0A139GUQ7_9PEZI|nr:hypothetical protein AC578_9028 [Pseudocercospora eumusae]
MLFGSLWSWWTSNTALHTYIYAQTLISLPFSVFSTYTTYQLQTVGYVIGTDRDGLPCMAHYCLVNWAGTRMDLNSVLLYMLAFSTGLSGLVTLFFAAYSDYWSRKHLLITILFVAYGVITVPVYWLQAYTEYNFKVLTALPIIFNIATNILVALLNIYIPYCMRQHVADHPTPANEDDHSATKRTYGFMMAALGAVANSAGALVMYCIVIAIQETTTNVTSPGLLVTTIVGFITIPAAAVCYFGLPRLPAKSRSKLKSGIAGPLIEFFSPFKDMYKRRSMTLLLIGYTIYIDTQYAVASVVGQLYYAEVKPGTLEYTLYSLSSTICGVLCSVLFLWLRPIVPIRLEVWLSIGYGILALTGVWGCIGFADIDFGYKLRWEFYVQQFLVSLSGIIAITSFRVLFSEMVPPCNEVRWFSLQYIISSATVWVNYVASAPLQNTTNNLRYPLVLSTIFATIAVVLELVRNLHPYFTRDRKHWIAHDLTEAEAEALARNSSCDNGQILGDDDDDRVHSVTVSHVKM